VNIHRPQLESDYHQAKDAIDKNFEQRKREMFDQNKREIEKEKQKWESFKRKEEKRIREEAESQADSKLAAFKQQLKLEEDAE
jgi:hypothetical protein